jgi:hypothetical protein
VTPRGVVTGLGVASPIGIGISVGQFWKAALVRHPSPTRPRRPTTRRRPRMGAPPAYAAARLREPGLYCAGTGAAEGCSVSARPLRSPGRRHHNRLPVGMDSESTERASGRSAGSIPVVARGRVARDSATRARADLSALAQLQ